MPNPISSSSSPTTGAVTLAVTQIQSARLRVTSSKRPISIKSHRPESVLITPFIPAPNAPPPAEHYSQVPIFGDVARPPSSSAATGKATQTRWPLCLIFPSFCPRLDTLRPRLLKRLVFHRICRPRPPTASRVTCDTGSMSPKAKRQRSANSVGMLSLPKPGRVSFESSMRVPPTNPSFSYLGLLIPTGHTLPAPGKPSGESLRIL